MARAGMTCTVDECFRAVECRGLCNAHYLRMRSGLPMESPVRAVKPHLMSDLDWIASMSIPDGDCLIFTGPLNDSGYGKIAGRRAHRIVAEAAYGPSDLCVLHSCDVPACVRPEHLRYGTRSENLHEAAERDRLPSGEDHRCAKITAADAVAIYLDARRLKDVAAAHGLSRQAAADIRARRTWRRVTQGLERQPA